MLVWWCTKARQGISILSFVWCRRINKTSCTHQEPQSQSSLLPLTITETSFSHSLRSLTAQKTMIDQGGSKPVLSYLLTSWIQYFLLLCKEPAIAMSLPMYQDTITRFGSTRAWPYMGGTPHRRGIWSNACWTGAEKWSLGVLAGQPGLCPCGTPREGPTAVLAQHISKPSDYLLVYTWPSDGRTKNKIFPRAFRVSCLKATRGKSPAHHRWFAILFFDLKDSPCIAFKGIFIRTKNNSNKRQSRKKSGVRRRKDHLSPAFLLPVSAAKAAHSRQSGPPLPKRVAINPCFQA